MLSKSAGGVLAGAMVLLATTQAYAQDVRARTALDSLIAIALSDHPLVLAAGARLDAARARVGPSAAWPDPMLMVGIENLPLAAASAAPPSGHGSVVEPEADDMMTMKMLGVAQTLPFPGKLAPRRRAAEQNVMAAQAQLDAARNRVVREIREAYYELAYLDRALVLAREAHRLSESVAGAAQARYVAGTGEQRAVLDARVAAARFAEQVIQLEAQRRAQQAVLARALAEPVGPSDIAPVLPEWIAHAANWPLPAAAQLQERAVRSNPELRARSAEIAALIEQSAAARKEYLPDFEVSIRYGQRNDRADMISASVGIPIPIHKSRKQDQLARAGEADVAAARAELLDESNRVRAEVAALHADLERIRAQVALFSGSIIPQAEAAVASARASQMTGRTELFLVLQRQNTLLEYQLARERLLADFAEKLAQLESLVGAEVLP